MQGLPSVPTNPEVRITGAVAHAVDVPISDLQRLPHQAPTVQRRLAGLSSDHPTDPPAASARGTIVRTEYLLNSLLSVIVESDREANVSGDLKVRFHFR